jgi:hypothetical protein
LLCAVAAFALHGAQLAKSPVFTPEKQHFESFDCGRAGRQEVRIMARAAGADRHVSLGVRNPPCPVTVWINGRLLGEAKATAYFDVADEFRQLRMNRIELERLAEGEGGLEVYLLLTPRVYIERAGPVRIDGAMAYIPVTVRNTLDNTADIYVEARLGSQSAGRSDNLPPGSRRDYEWKLRVDPGAAGVTVTMEKLAEALEGAYSYKMEAEWASAGTVR